MSRRVAVQNTSPIKLDFTERALSGCQLIFLIPHGIPARSLRGFALQKLRHRAALRREVTESDLVLSWSGPGRVRSAIRICLSQGLGLQEILQVANAKFCSCWL